MPWTRIAAGFPPTLVTNAPKTSLQGNQTPNAYGLDPTAEGFLTAGSAPTTTAYTPSTVTATLYGQAGVDEYKFDKIYDRLWGRRDKTTAAWTGQDVFYGAPNYLSTSYVPQSRGYLSTAQLGNVTAIVPFGSDNVLIGTAGGSMLLSNCRDPRGFFMLSHTFPQIKVPAEANMVPYEGFVYVSNTTALFRVTPDGKLEELSLPVRGDAFMLSKSLQVSADGRFVSGLSGGNATFVFDAATNRIFSYATSGFRYDSPKIRNEDGSPFVVNQVQYVYETTDGNSGTVSATTYNEVNGWGTAQSLTFDPTTANDLTGLVYTMDAGRQAAREFQVRLDTLSSNIKIREIWIEADQLLHEGYTS